MKTFRAFEDNFSFTDSKNYHLSLQIGPGTLTYAILDIADRKYIGLKHTDFKVTSEKIFKELLLTELENDSFLKHAFASVAVLYQSFRSMLVPESLFDQKNLKAFLKFHHDIDEKDHIKFFKIKEAEAFVIFSVPNYIEETIISKFPKAQFYHHCWPFIRDSLTRTDKNETITGLHINFASDFFDVLIVRNNKILLYNSFFYKKYTDVIYFVANILNLFSLKPDVTKLFITGNWKRNRKLKTN